MRYRIGTLAVVVAVSGVMGGCAWLNRGHATAGTDVAPAKRTGAAALYPDAQTSGATNPKVTQESIRKTICHQGWITAVRPPVSYLKSLKQKQLAALGATVADPQQKCMPKSANPRCYQEDDLICLELGGASRDPKNLWPQPAPRAKEKDWVEDYLHKQVCSGAMTLEQAQHAIVADWYAVYVANHHEAKGSPAAGSSPTAGAKKRSAAK